MIKRQELHNKIGYVLLGALFVVLPTYKKLAPLILGLLLLNWIIEGQFRTKFRNLFSQKGGNKLLFTLMIVFYIMHVVALLYTDNMKDGLFELEKKLSFIIYPLLFFPVVSMSFTKTKMKLYLLLFTGATFGASVVCLIQSIIKYTNTGDPAMMYYQNFTFYEHPTYVAMFMLTALIFITGVVISGWKDLSKSWKYVSIGLIPWYVFIIMLASSRAAIIALILTGLLTMIFVVVKTKKYWIGIVFMALLAVSVPVGKIMMPHVFDRFYVGLDEVFTAKKMDDIKHWNGTTIRVQVYYSAFEVIKENFAAGVSPGDVTDELVMNYKKHGFRHAAERGYNAHNQFLQAFIGLGVVGFLVLFAIIAIPFVAAMRRRDYSLMTFSFMVTILFMFESMLQLQAGVMFIVAGLAFLSCRSETIKNKNKKSTDLSIL